MATGAVKISEFTLVTGVTGNEYLPMLQSGDNVIITHDHAMAGYSPTGHNHTGVYQPVGNYLTAESDPIFAAASGMFSITGHAHAEYITGFTETDPVFAAASGNFAAAAHTHDDLITGFDETDPIFTAASGMFSTTGHVHAEYITGFDEADPVFTAASGMFSTTGHEHTEYITGFTETDPIFTAASGMFSTTGHAHAGTYIEDITVVPDTVFPIDYLYKKVSGVDILLTEIPKSNGIVAGGLVTWDTGLTFLISPSAYYIEGSLYSTESSSVTLPAADPSNPRIDIIVVDTSEQVTYVTGVAAENPVKPMADPVTQIELTQVQINAGETTPSFVSTDELIFDEHVTGTEFTASISGATADWDYATGAFHGSKCASISTIGNNDTMTFTGGSTYDITDFETLLMYIKLKASMSSQQSLYVSFWNGTTQVSTEYLLPLSKTNITSWQNISIATASISFSSSTFTLIKLRWVKTGTPADHAGFYLDFIKLHSGTVQPTYTDTDNYTDGVTWTAASRTLTLQRTGTLPDLTAVIDYSFLGLTDTPTGYSGSSGMAVKVNAAGTGLEFAAAGGGTFISLSDTPTGFTNASGMVVAVNSSGTALEFTDIPVNHLQIKTVTGTTYTLILSDDSKYMRCNNATGVVVTVPLHSSVSFDEGAVISFIQIGAGVVSVTGETTGVTLNAYDGLSTYGQYAGMQIIKVSDNVWDCLAGT